MRQFYETLARYTISVLPAEGGERRELRDYASTAQQFGCMALVKMGVAEPRPYGCELLYPREEAPMRVAGESLWLPDAAHVMLALAEQFGDLHFDRPQRPPAKGAMAQYDITGKRDDEEEEEESVNPFKALYPELFAAAEETMRLARRKAERMLAIPAIYEGAAAGKSSPEVLQALGMIGWIAAGRWTAASEIGLWRRGAVEGFEQTAQFEGAVEKCIADLPQDVREAVTRIHEGPDAEVLDAKAAQIRETVERFNKRRRREHELSDEDIRTRAIGSWQRNAEWDLDHSFFARWRMQTGWDNDEKLLPLFHDPVAQAMRRTVLGAVLE